MNRFGIELGKLMENHLPDILFNERSNRDHIHLYRIDDYWVAFERSAFHLCHLYASPVINAMKVYCVPLPIVVASLPEKEMPFAVDGMECMKRTLAERIYKTGKPVDGRLFKEWHNRNTIVFQGADLRRS